MRPFFCFYGGKWRAAKHYPTPRFSRVCEPFAGAAGYSVWHEPAEVVLCDVDPLLADLWSWLCSISPDEVRALPLLGEGQTVGDLDVCPEAKSLIGFWINKGKSQPAKSPSKWMRQGIRPNSFWSAHIRERIASQVTRLGNWSVQDWGAVELMNDELTYGARPTTYFVDPPYRNAAGRHYKFNDVDYCALADLCRGLASVGHQVIVCENVGARWAPFVPLADIKANHKTKVSREAIWLPGAA